MAKKKGKQKEGIQVGLFEEQERTAPDIGFAPLRLKIIIGSTMSCPHCGEDIKPSPDGNGVRCTKCWWFQLRNENPV